MSLARCTWKHAPWGGGYPRSYAFSTEGDCRIILCSLISGQSVTFSRVLFDLWSVHHAYQWRRKQPRWWDSEKRSYSRISSPMKEKQQGENNQEGSEKNKTSSSHWFNAPPSAWRVRQTQPRMYTQGNTGPQTQGIKTLAASTGPEALSS